LSAKSEGGIILNEINDNRLAVLIDADNISYKNIKNMLIEVSRYGTPTIKRIYGDWTRPELVGWKNSLLEHALTPMQQYGYTSGKNSTDSAMIIDAMDILYTNAVDGFCIVSSDSDFTRLAIRLREAGKVVYGIGERKTPVSFIAACSKFIYIEILSQTQQTSVKQPESKTPEVKQKQGELSTIKDKTADSQERVVDSAEKLTVKTDKNDLKVLIASSVTDLSDDDGWANLAAVGANVNKKEPDFDPRNYGFQRLSLLLKSLNAFDLEERIMGNSKSKIIFIRNKPEVIKAPNRRKRKKKNDEVKQSQ
jgi:uncharacterized LabA/DUF88 family protein